jgi:hypothetical protein
LNTYPLVKASFHVNPNFLANSSYFGSGGFNSVGFKNIALEAIAP